MLTLLRSNNQSNKVLLIPKKTVHSTSKVEPGIAGFPLLKKQVSRAQFFLELTLGLLSCEGLLRGRGFIALRALSFPYKTLFLFNKK